MECITLSLTSTKYYFFNAHSVLSLSTPHSKKLLVPCAQKILSYGPNSPDIQLGKSQKWHSIFYWILQDRVHGNGLLPFRVFMMEFATGRFSLLICAPLWCSYGIPPSSTCFLIAKNEESRPDIFFLLSWPLPVDLTRDKFRLNFWVVKMILWLIFRRIRYGSSDFFLVWLLWHMDRKKYRVYLKTPLTCAVARAHW